MTTPAWKRLFQKHEFDWSFRMRPGNARAFFADTEDGGSILREKQSSLMTHPGRHLGETPAAAPLVSQLAALMQSWGLAMPSDPSDFASLARMVEPDIMLMDAATKSLAAACVCMPSSWDLRHALGKPVHAVHDVVPQLNEKIGSHIDRFLGSIPIGKSFCRENWSITLSPERNYHPALNREKPTPATPPLDLFLRLEHQLFTALPDGVLMGIRIHTTPFAEIHRDPETWHSLTEIIRSMPDDVAHYKGMLQYRIPLAEAMASITTN